MGWLCDRQFVPHSPRKLIQVHEGCTDPDCKDPSSCEGNKIEVTSQQRIRVFAPHHKTDRRKSKMASGPIDVILPEGPLTTLLKFFIEEGWPVLQQNCIRGCSTLFMSKGGKALDPQPFSCANFSQYWSNLLSRTAPPNLGHFTATLARTSFVEAYTKEMGEESWEGAAAIMGNSPATWRQHYNTIFKVRAMQGAANSFSTFLERNESTEDEGRVGPSTSAAATFVPFAPEFAAPRPVVAATPTTPSRRRGKRDAADMGAQAKEDAWAEWGMW